MRWDSHVLLTAISNSTKASIAKCIIMFFFSCALPMVFDIGTVQICWASLTNGKWWKHALLNTVKVRLACNCITACHIIFQSHHRMCHMHSCPSAAWEATSKRQKTRYLHRIKRQQTPAWLVPTYQFCDTSGGWRIFHAEVFVLSRQELQKCNHYQYINIAAKGSHLFL